MWCILDYNVNACNNIGCRSQLSCFNPSVDTMERKPSSSTMFLRQLKGLGLNFVMGSLSKFSSVSCMLYAQGPSSGWCWLSVMRSGVRRQRTFFELYTELTPVSLAGDQWSPLVNMCIITTKTKLWVVLWSVPVCLHERLITQSD